MGHTVQITSHHIWESKVSLFMFCWSWFKFTVVHIWRAELDNSWAVTGNMISSVSGNRHEAIGQANASMSSALCEQIGPEWKFPVTHCPQSHKITVIISEGPLHLEMLGNETFSMVKCHKLLRPVCRKKYYCFVRLNKSVRKNMGVLVLL